MAHDSTSPQTSKAGIDGMVMPGRSLAAHSRQTQMVPLISGNRRLSLTATSGLPLQRWIQQRPWPRGGPAVTGKAGGGGLAELSTNEP